MEPIFNVKAFIDGIVKCEIDDDAFDSVYPEHIQDISYIHWTPIEIIQTATEWLKEDHSINTILDIGSGVGKVCVIGALCTNMNFVGVEKRNSLYQIANELAEAFEVTAKCSFLNEDVVNVGFQPFDAFYYFNPFLEQKVDDYWIDKEIEFSKSLFDRYETHVIHELDKKDRGTKLVAYCSDELPLPKSYKIKNMMYDGKLVLWEKTN